MSQVPLSTTTVDILEPAQGVEVMSLVVVQRRFLAEPPERRLGIGVQIHVVRVVVEIAFSTDRHAVYLSWSWMLNKTNVWLLSQNFVIGNVKVSERTGFWQIYTLRLGEFHSQRSRERFSAVT